MKIHFIIEIEDDGRKRTATVQQLAQVGEEVKRKPGRPRKIYATEPAPAAPVPASEPAAPTHEVNNDFRGQEPDPKFINCIRDLPQPFTRRAIAIATGMDPTAVTLRLNRLKHRGWVMSPAREMWVRTNQFGIKPE